MTGRGEKMLKHNIILIVLIWKISMIHVLMLKENIPNISVNIDEKYI
jgi:cell division protein FtsL